MSTAAHRLRRLGRPVSRGMPWLLLAVVAAVVGLSLLLVPRGVELALLRHGHGEQAERARLLLEARFASGDRSAPVVGALARARAQHGDASGAMALLREWVTTRPDDIDALQSLADYCAAAQRSTDCLDVLERLQQQRPSAARQRELLRLYGAIGTPAQQARAQAELIDRFDAGDVADYLSLAKARAERGDAALALATLDRMARRFPQAVDLSTISTQMSLSLTAHAAAEALARGHAWLRAHPADVERGAAQLAAVLSAAKRPELAAQFLDAYLVPPAARPKLLAAWARAMADAGRSADALVRLESVDAAADVESELAALRVSLALAHGRLDPALRAARALGLQRVPGAQLAGMAALALAAGRDDVLELLLRGGEARIGAHDAVIAAQSALRLKQRAAALRWTDAARAAAPNPASLRALQVARLYEQLGEPAKALQALRGIARPDTERAALGEWARLFIALGRADEGLASIERLRRDQPAAPWQEPWALLATAAKRHDEVLRWLLASPVAEPAAHLHRDLLHLAMDHKAYTLAVAAGERLVRADASDADRLLLVNVLLAAGRPAEALAQLRVLRERGSVDARLYRATLLAAWRRGAPVADELRQDTLQRLAGSSEPHTRDADIATLQALGAHAELLPTLERLAAADPQRWLGAFTDAAERSGATARLTAMWLALGQAESTPPALRMQVGFRLLGAGEKGAGERVFRALAAHAAPGDTATRQLLFVWGPRPQPEQMDWLEMRARGATGEAKAKWLSYLTERGGAARAIAAAGKPVPRADDGGVFDAYLEAALTSGDKAALRQALLDGAAGAPSAAQLSRLARHATALDDPALERRFALARVAAGSHDAQTARALGLQAVRAGDAVGAERWLTAFNSATGGDAETHRIVGEMQLQRGEVEAARRSFEAALNGLERAGETTRVARVAKAGLLNRLGRTAQARQLYDALLAEQPDDDDLRADYAALLLATGDSGQAQALLAGKKR
jgi:cellulose synthase operon protein C